MYCHHHTKHKRVIIKQDINNKRRRAVSFLNAELQSYGIILTQKVWQSSDNKTYSYLNGVKQAICVPLVK